MREALRRAFPSVASVTAALALCFLAVVLTLGPGAAFDSFSAMWWGAFGDWPRFLARGESAALLRPLGEAGTKSALLMLTGLSVTAAFRVGLFNIGAQGQLTVGALSAAVVGAQTQIHLPGPLHLALALAAGAAAGALYALGPALLKLGRGVHEVISTIMLNWVAVSLVDNWLVVGPLRAQASGDNSIAGTAEVAASARLPLLLGESSRLNVGFVMSLAVVGATWFFLARCRRGFEWRAVGLNVEAARAAGISVGPVIVEAMATAGACAGLAGAVLVLGTEGKYPATLGSPYGFDGIAMALLGQGHPVGVAAVSLLFGGLRAGGTRMQLFGVHKSFPELIQGLALLLVAAQLVWSWLGERLLSRRLKEASS